LNKQLLSLPFLSKEAINNIAKYSRAKNVNFIVRISGKTLYLSFEDDGVGFDEDLVKKGNGINNMKARINEMKGGELDLQSSKMGTKVIFKIIIP
jgi:signal transduction histidine kinase